MPRTSREINTALQEIIKIVTKKLEDNGIGEDLNICELIKKSVCTIDAANELMYVNDISKREYYLQMRINNAINEELSLNQQLKIKLKCNIIYLNGMSTDVCSLNQQIKDIDKKIRYLKKQNDYCQLSLCEDEIFEQMTVQKENVIKDYNQGESTNEPTSFSPRKTKSNEAFKAFEVYNSFEKPILMADFDIAYQKEKAEGKKYLDFNKVQ